MYPKILQARKGLKQLLYHFSESPPCLNPASAEDSNHQSSTNTVFTLTALEKNIGQVNMQRGDIALKNLSPWIVILRYNAEKEGVGDSGGGKCYTHIKGPQDGTHVYALCLRSQRCYQSLLMFPSSYLPSSLHKASISVSLVDKVLGN